MAPVQRRTAEGRQEGRLGDWLDEWEEGEDLRQAIALSLTGATPPPPPASSAAEGEGAGGGGDLVHVAGTPGPPEPRPPLLAACTIEGCVARVAGPAGGQALACVLAAVGFDVLVASLPADVGLGDGVADVLEGEAAAAAALDRSPGEEPGPGVGPDPAQAWPQGAPVVTSGGGVCAARPAVGALAPPCDERTVPTRRKR